MKLLLDACVWGGTAPALRQAGHDVVWAGDWAQDPGDDEILAMAHQQGRTLVTLDKDFGELAIVHQRPHCGIVRLVNIAARQQASFCLQVLDRHAADLEAGAIATVDARRMRIRTATDSEEAD